MQQPRWPTKKVTQRHRQKKIDTKTKETKKITQVTHPNGLQPKWPTKNLDKDTDRHRKKTKTQTQTKTKTKTKTKHRDKERKKHKQRHSGQERQTNLQNCKYIYQLINKTQITYPQRLRTTNFLQTR